MKETEVKKEAEVSESSDMKQLLMLEIARHNRESQKEDQERNRRDKYREDLRRQEAERIAQEKAVQAACPHLRENNTSTFFWNPMPPNGEVVGVCCRCMRLAKPTDADYFELRKIPTGRVMYF